MEEESSKKEIKKKLKKLSKYAKEAKLNKDYGDIASEYILHAKYLTRADRVNANGNIVKKSKRCLMCKKNPCTSVFFPCRHACVCEPCREEHCIGVKDSSTQSAWRACPLCMEEIKIVLPRNGKEEESYWKWVHGVKPPIPSHRDFVSNFKHAGVILEKEGAGAIDILHTKNGRGNKHQTHSRYYNSDSSDEDSSSSGGSPGHGGEVVWYIKPEKSSCCILV